MPRRGGYRLGALQKLAAPLPEHAAHAHVVGAPALGRGSMHGMAGAPHRPVGYEAAGKGGGLLVVLQGGAGVHVHREEVLLLQHRSAARGPQLLAQRLEAQRVAGRGAAAPLHARVPCGA